MLLLRVLFSLTFTLPSFLALAESAFPANQSIAITEQQAIALFYQRNLDLTDAKRSYTVTTLYYHTALANRSNAWADLLMAYGEEVQQ